MTARLLTKLYIVGWRGSNGSCSTIIAASHLGAGSTIIIIRHVYQVRRDSVQLVTLAYIP